MEEIIKNISSTVLGGILGYFIRLFIEHRLAIDRIRENIKITEFNKAAASLRASFSSTLSFIYIAEHHTPHDKPDINEHIKNSIFCHGAAVEEFRPFVNSNLRNDYQKAWEEYRNSVTIDQYALSAEAKIEGISSEKYLIDKIHNIVRFAELK